MSSFFIEFLKEKLKVFKVKSSVLHLILLKLRILLDFTLNCFSKYSKVVKIFLKKSFELDLR